MRIAFFLMTLIFCSSLVWAQDYKLVWEDNFDGNELNPATWNIEQRIGIWNTGQNKELQHYKAENVSVGDDGNGNNCLILTAKKENYQGYGFTSGRINTRGKFTVKYGKIQARIKLPNLANGLWPAFWLLGSNNLKWPASGEIDILEAGHSDGILNNAQNNTFGGALHWENNDSYAGYGKKALSETPLNEDYHVFTAEWNESRVSMYLDDNTTPYFTMNIDGADAEEFRDYPMFVLFNMAVGGSYTGIYNPSNITAPMPAKMFVDYVRVYQKEGTGELSLNPEITKSMAVYAEESQFEYVLDPDFDASISTRGVAERTGETPKEGNKVLSYQLRANQDYNISIESLAAKNLSELAKKGSLDFYIKTNSQADIHVGLKDSTGAENWITLNTSSPYNCKRDQTWSRVVIPLSEFENLDLSATKGMFMIKGTPASDAFISIDRVVISSLIANADIYGIYTNNPLITQKFTVDNTNGFLYIWENTLTAIKDAPSYDGQDVLAFSSQSAKTWFGYGLFSNAGVDLTAFAEGYLKLALRTTSSNDFWIGVAGANNTEAKIDFKNGSDPYGFVRDGRWHRITIPVSDLLKKGVDLSLCKNIFMVGGAPAISNILVDDVYFSKTEEDFANNLLNPNRNIPLSTEIIKITADNYRIYSENTAIPDFFEIDNKRGHIYIWENSMLEIQGETPFDGTQQLSFKSRNIGWYGFGIFSDYGLDLTHFANGFLSLSLKTSSSEDFWIGMQGDEKTEARFEFNSASRIKIERDNKWHRVTIPVNKLTSQGLKLEKCGNIFMLGGTTISDIAVDDIVLSISSNPPANPNINVSTTVVSEENEKLRIYPVPTNDFVKLQSASKISRVEIYNQSGKLVYSAAPEISQIKVDLQNFTPGVYLVTVILNDQEVVSRKILRK